MSYREPERWTFHAVDGKLFVNIFPLAEKLFEG